MSASTTATPTATGIEPAAGLDPTGLHPAARAAAIEHFVAKLRYETDPSDVAAAITAGERFVLVDTRGHAAWHQGRVPGAIHLPTAEIDDRAPREIPLDLPVVVYCWSPGCNGSTKAALRFSRLGYAVREMIGGFEYWAKEGLGVEDDDGALNIPLDILTAPRPGVDGVISCEC
ncbi:rhodanese-like domain-containing protein [Schumannella luteola]|uniref:Rhodanese-related sulfurtransferase n=1 Tax=Schumannella luteola TaxID=472059 RepID=A0A852Y960_9MICO|nr:rhodanese-like domain-containing protein [Schumannella luteola]NYG97910.1 rhodanese-related sulfurtransferase [Schumannella luteola]TPX03052.1 sulfurtransferase [Schumannella luteola]